MKNYIITALAFAGILMSCNSSDKTTTTIEETSEADTTINQIDKNLKPIDSNDALIATALMAAPEASRANCKVIGYNLAGEFVTLKEGNNEFIVLADDPNKEGFSAACYHKDLEPFMARGRTLKAEGKKHQEIFDIREAEVKAGKLNIPTGATLHIYYGKNVLYNPKTSKVDGAKLRYVVYMPYATSASTGLPEAPAASNHPWIMNPGTHRAHIMISPLADDGM
ncbi:hypothetical protein H8K90_11295 [Winogradskyella echinorum]|uniref:Lipoprotein n=1 Tax=Winogradskyella echinorum TaxID=538189 RepID=A0ABR6Y2J9_9FLAO|nr:hypothetical protein [Winogradskyella echinorum]MBC3846967.1 hypothetical protein [Winogradskyella echinorum]MBC5751315.1 hypothetical protein [Winogradskyella echinorum]